ncbi:MAG: hypothetical protein JWO04_1788 [Gammaproteobacteria bacterium]|nr:hypothetical protein [Gammaproteobacteria bacterium]
MPFMDIAAGEISSIQPVQAYNKNVVLLISQRNASRPLVVKSEDGTGRNNFGAMQSSMPPLSPGCVACPSKPPSSH